MHNFIFSCEIDKNILNFLQHIYYAKHGKSRRIFLRRYIFFFGAASVWSGCSSWNI